MLLIVSELEQTQPTSKNGKLERYYFTALQPYAL